MDIKVVDQKGEILDKAASTEIKADYGTTIPEGVVMLQQIGSLFDMTMPEINSYKTELNTLLEYAKSKTDDHSVEGLKWAITDLGIRLGTPPMGEKRIKQMTRYAHLYMETLNNKKLMQNMVRGDEDDN